MKPTTFRDRLRRFRLALALTPEQLGEKCGLHPQVVRKLEDGQRVWPRLDTARKLAKGLGVTLDELAG
ncbi:MAG: helix-turn-helix transcriptional regulator [Pirellulaceae bacterium]|nr:helix-turn-helix transcriptional regulator [Pirellulaceae bacterium]